MSGTSGTVAQIFAGAVGGMRNDTGGAFAAQVGHAFRNMGVTRPVIPTSGPAGAAFARATVGSASRAMPLYPPGHPAAGQHPAGQLRVGQLDAQALQQLRENPVVAFYASPAGQILSTASAAASTYHGYKRNKSIGWALWWGLMGAMFPIITPTIAVAQGFGKSRSGK